IEQNLHFFNGYYVENFHSSIHLQTNESSSSENIIRQAKNLDQKHGNNKLKKKFIDTHNVTYTEKELDFMKKKASNILLNFFTSVNDNLGETVIYNQIDQISIKNHN
ncbi:15586_t:CDS:1, partial [Entrophospora sp. SA101]